MPVVFKPFSGINAAIIILVGSNTLLEAANELANVGLLLEGKMLFTLPVILIS